MTSPFEEGSPSAPILVLAEAPASVEVRMNRPLAGPSGDVFNDCLHAAGLIRSNIYILNTWPFRVFKEKDHIFMLDQPSVKLWDKIKGFTDEGWEATAETRARVAGSLANIIVTMGNPALALAINRRPITKWRGSPLWSERFARKVIPTIHPAATLHGTYLWRYMIVSDLEKAKRHMNSPVWELVKREFLIDPSFSDVMDYMKMVSEQPRFATDLECINHQVNCFCLAPNKFEAMIVPMADDVGNAWWDEGQEMAIWKGYAKLLGNPEIMKINQNIVGFDSPFLLQQNNIFTYGEIGDTMIAQKILYPDFKKGLDFICSIHTDEPYYKDEGKMWKGTGGNLEQFWVYNGKDGCIAIEAWDALAEEMTQKDYWSTYNRVVNRMRFLNYMGIRGIRVDRERLAATHADVSRRLEEKEAELEKVAKYPFNVSSPKQCQLYFYGTLGCTPYHNRDGGITTDDKAMARIFRKYNHPEAKLVQEIRALRKLKSTYLEINFDPDNRLRCSWDPTGSKFGRLSSRETIFGTGMNQQNLHPEFKHFLIADEEPLI